MFLKFEGVYVCVYDMYIHMCLEYGSLDVFQMFCMILCVEIFSDVSELWKFEGVCVCVFDMYIYMCMCINDMSIYVYGVSTISRLLKIIGLFCRMSFLL